MKTKTLLQRLIEGSRNLDKMREDAHEVLSLIISFLRGKEIGKHPVSTWSFRVAEIETPSGKWTLEDNSRREGEQPGPIISYWSNIHPNGRCANYMSQNPNGLDRVSAYYVKAFLEELPFLLELVLKEFPEIEGDFNWKVIMDAAEA